MALAAALVALAVSRYHGHAAAPPPTSAAPPATTPSGPPCPLTGQPTANGVPQRPALAVKVDNYPDARPQSGLDKADVVFEEPVEGGITRLVAVFQCSQASLVGPIRSARAVDAQILPQLSHPLFVHAGGITPVIGLLRSASLVDDDVFTHGGIVQHPAGRVAPYDTYAATADAWALQPGDTTPPAPLFTFSSEPPMGTPVTRIHIPFSQTSDVTWTWDQSSARWELAYSSSPATVAGGSQIAVANVVVQTVQVSYGPWAENEQGGLEVQSQLVGSGPALVLRNGEEITGTWQRSSVTSPTRLVAANGDVIPLAPGQTWVELVPAAIAVTGR